MAFKIVFALTFVAFAASVKIQVRQDDGIGSYHGYDGGHHFEGHDDHYQHHHHEEEHHEEHHHEEEHEDHHEPAEYYFHYDVHDDHTGDIKSHHEKRHGDEVSGHYSLIDSDGHKRTVEYHADKKTGFHATVHREPTDIKIPVPAPAPAHGGHEGGEEYAHHEEYAGYSGHDEGQSHVTVQSGHTHYNY